MDFVAKLSTGTVEFINVYGIENKDFSVVQKSSISAEILYKEKTLVTIKEDEIIVNRRCTHQIFVTYAKGRQLVISSSLSALLNVKKNKVYLNLRYLIDYIYKGPQPRSDTAFEGIYYISPGGKWLPNVQHALIEPLVDTQTNIFEALHEHLERSVPPDSIAGLEYSGGLESTVLLHILKKMKFKRLKLYHLTDSMSGETDDLDRVKRSADENQVELEILDYGSSSPFRSALSSELKPSFPHPGLVNTEYLDYTTRLTKCDNVTFINGSGGDSLFCAHPQKALPYELLCNCRFIQASRSVINLSEYFRRSLIKTIISSRKQYIELKSKLTEHDSVINSYSEVFNSDNLKLHSPEKTHNIFQVNRSLCYNSRLINAQTNRFEMLTNPSSNGSGKYLYPFLCYESLAAAMAVPDTNLLKGKLDRYYLRKLSHERFNDSNLLSTRKGGVGGLTQRAFRENKIQILGVLLNGPLGEKNLINNEFISAIVEGVAIGAIACPTYIVNLFSLNIFIRYWDDVHHGIR